MTPSQKIAKAKQLIIEATQELRAKRLAEKDANLCQCGHRHDQHSVTYSVNYTGGFCMVGNHCACRWFMQADRKLTPENVAAILSGSEWT